jgi:cell wall-associated NlpC family hydrolase
MATREDFVHEARKWLGTPFHHQGRIKNIGCDCLGLLLGITNALGICHGYGDDIAYGFMPDTKTFLDNLDLYMKRISIIDASYGDVLVMKFGGIPTHLAIITDRGIIHCYALGPKCVVEHALSGKWPSRIVRAYRVKGLE